MSHPEENLENYAYNNSEEEELQMARLAANLLSEKKAENILLLDLHNVSSYLNYFIIATCLSSLHAKNLGQHLEDLFNQYDIKRLYKDKDEYEAGWFVLDFGDVIVHLFSEEMREHYNIEGMWENAQKIDWRM